MKRLSKMINGRSSTCKAEAQKMTAQKGKFASLHEEEEEEDDEEEEEEAVATQVISSTSKNVVNVVKKFVCNKCGKAFQYSKAMCGHMASHSQKEKPLSSVGAKKKLMMMEMKSDSDTESGAGPMRRRSRRTKYKKHDYVSCGSKAKLDVVNDCSSESSGVEQEQEVAVSLMMLSRDSSNWGGLNSIGDSLENNSVVLEDRLTSTKFGKHNGLSSGYDLDEIKENYRRKRVESLGKFDSGSVRNEVTNVETDVKVRSSRRNKLEEEPHLSLKKLKSLMDGDGYSQIQRPNAGSFPKRDLFNESDSAGMCKRAETETPVASQPHQPFHANAVYEKCQNRFETDAYCNIRKGKEILDDNSGNVGDGWNKWKHDSPVCYKDLGSGNTLGYHRGMHSEDSRCDEVTPNSKRQGSHSRNFIDLNLPAPMEDEETNESMGSY